MSDWQQLPFDEESFRGTARLFPVPGLVLFPHVMQTLHVFEERYRAMMEDAVAGDELIAMATLEPGWETDYAGRPPLSKHACLGRILTHHRFPDGRFNLMLLGVRRLRLVGEVDPPQAFRQAHVEIVPECGPANPEPVRQRLLTALQAGLPEAVLNSEQMSEVLSRELPLKVLTDLLGFALPLEEAVKRSLLADPDAASRAETLIKSLAASTASGDGENRWSPPAFSEN
ncbi:MAG: LON peptidase substrate-binding domain-containing protein [Planctomycetota bacterium]